MNRFFVFRRYAFALCFRRLNIEYVVERIWHGVRISRYVHFRSASLGSLFLGGHDDAL